MKIRVPSKKNINPTTLPEVSVKSNNETIRNTIKKGNNSDKI